MSTGINAIKLAANILKSRFATFHGLAEVYRPSAIDKWDKIAELTKAGAEKASRSEIARKMRVFYEYYRVEMSPPGVDEKKKIEKDFATTKEFVKKGCYKEMTVRQAIILLLVCFEISLWFFLGETIGKMHLVGYLV